MWAHHSSSRAHLLYVTDVISWHMIIYHLICHNFYTAREYSGFQAHMAKSMTTLGNKNHLYSAKTCRRGRLFGFMDCAVAICYLVTLLLIVLKRSSFGIGTFLNILKGKKCGRYDTEMFWLERMKEVENNFWCLIIKLKTVLFPSIAQRGVHLYSSSSPGHVVALYRISPSHHLPHCSSAWPLTSCGQWNSGREMRQFRVGGINCRHPDLSFNFSSSDHSRKSWEGVSTSLGVWVTVVSWSLCCSIDTFRMSGI